MVYLGKVADKCPRGYRFDGTHARGVLRLLSVQGNHSDLVQTLRHRGTGTRFSLEITDISLYVEIIH